MTTLNEFHVLAALATVPKQSQRDIAAQRGISLGSVNTALRSLKERGCVDKSNKLTSKGKKELAPYKVDNAIIMAAGMSTRFAPISYERPKGMLRVRGEVLIERQIRQLKEAGIDDITVVVGYMKEQFFYLEDMFGVKIRVNEQYAVRNNNSTLYLVCEQLGNTYICSSDDYFVDNVFEPYVYKAYYAAVFFAGKTNEYCLTTGAGKRITAVTIGGHDSYGMLGHAYFDRAFSKKFTDILVSEYDRLDTASKLWEDIYIDHVAELDMVMRTYDTGVINEFDSLEELREFDPEFINNVDSAILDNICKTLEVKRSEIMDVTPISQGLTNLSFRFDCRGKTYVYRHPGAGTAGIINRESEAYSQAVARDLGLDDTFVYEDPQVGWKISYFIDGASELDYHNWTQVENALAIVRKLHSSGAQSQWEFNEHENMKGIIALLDERHRASYGDFKSLFEVIDKLACRVAADGVPTCLCHNNFCAQNFLVTHDKMYLIDWEYSGMSDYAGDLGTFICCSDYGYDEALRAIESYFGRTPTDEELAHCVAWIAISSYHWFIWALYKDACGKPVGEWLYVWYRNAKLFGAKASALYEEIDV